jgi:hypothetical protein
LPLALEVTPVTNKPSDLETTPGLVIENWVG